MSEKLQVKDLKVWKEVLENQRKELNEELNHFGAGDLQIIILDNATYHIRELTKIYETIIERYEAHEKEN